MLGNYENWGGDNPMENANWNTPMDFSSKRTDESIKNSIHSKCNSLVERDKAKFFRVEVYKAIDIEWAAPYYGESDYLLFFFWA